MPNSTIEQNIFPVINPLMIIMKRLINLFIIVLLVIPMTNGQSTETDTLSQSKMKQLDFMIGKWEGSGWMMGFDGTKNDFDQTEHIQYKLDGTAVLVEGLGRSDGRIVHNALAIITFNKETDKYNFQSYLSTGRGGSFPAEIIDNKMYWYPRDNMRYVISLNEEGQWFEVGEMKRNGEWFQFFEMTLDKAD